MKYLKLFEGFKEPQDCFTQFDVDEICDLFRDFVDEFDIERYTDDDSEHFTYESRAYNDKSGYIKSDSVQFNNVNNIERLEFIVFFPLEIEYHIKEESILSSLDSFINRVNEMGFNIKKEIEYDGNDNGIEDGDIDTITIKITI